MAPWSRSPAASQIESISLQEFVRQALLDICIGIIEAQKEAQKPGSDREHNAFINPIPNKSEGFNWADYEREIEFDVLITGERRNVGNARAGLTLFGAGGALSTDRTSASSVAHRLKFSVPVVLPGWKIGEYDKKSKP